MVMLFMLLPFLNFVFVDSVVAAPVIHVDHWVAIHRGRVPAATSNNLVAFWLYWRVAKLGYKPDAG
jgi:hypothetical protein